jgi:tetratricopeptide (TPR) repeat protein
MEQQSPATTVRIPASFPVMVQLRTPQLEPLDGEVRAGITRDINEGGLGLEVRHLPSELAAKLATGDSVNLDIDIRIERHTLRLEGKSTWLRVVERHGEHIGCIGVEYVGVSPETAQKLVRAARRKVERGRGWRIAAVATAAIAVGGGILWASTHAEDIARLASAESRMMLALDAINRGTNEVQRLRQAVAERDEAMARKDAELVNLRDVLAREEEEFNLVRASLNDRRLSPPPMNANSAVHHLERGQWLWDHRQEAAAVAEFEQAVSLDPNMAPAHFALGEANVYFGRLPQAITCYRHYLELRPDAADADSIRTTVADLETVLLQRPVNR